MNSNITKMNIVYKREFEAEAEYLKEFFSLIGFVVTEICPTSDYDLLKKEINDIIYDENTITIMLNHYGAPVSNSYNKFAIIYMYFYAKDGIAFANEMPFVSLDTFRFFTIRTQLMNGIGINQCKRNTRSKALDIIIDKLKFISSSDLYSSIKNFKEIYISENCESDLFYTLQAIKCIDIIFKTNYFKLSLGEGDKNYDFTLSLDDQYIKNIFNELARIFNSLTPDMNNLYLMYAKVKIAKLILDTYKILDHKSKKEFNIFIPNIRIDDFKCFFNINLNQLKNRNFMASYLFYTEDANNYIEMNSYKHVPIPLTFYKLKLQQIIKDVPFYGDMKDLYIQPVRDLYFSIKECATLESTIFTTIDYIYHIFKLQSEFRVDFDKEFDAVVSNIFKSKKNVNKLSDVLGMYIYMKVGAAKYILMDRDYSAKTTIQNAYSILEKFEQAPNIRNLSDANEKAFIDFINFHTNSKYLYYLYQALWPWVSDIVLVPRERILVQKRLEQFNQGNRRGFTKGRRRYSTLQEIRYTGADKM